MEYQKVSAELGAVYDQFVEAGPAALVPRADVLGLVTLTEPARPARSVVFVRCAEDADLGPLLHPLVTELNATAGAIRTGIVALDELPALAGSAAVEQVIEARYLRPLMDVAPSKLGVPDLVRQTDLTGEGVLVGVVDTGIDARHPAFTGRIERIWDQTMRGSGVAEGRYGVELTGNRLVESRDTHGHGTHVAGIAAGDDTAFPGIAPKARIVMVKTTLMDAHIADGVRYCLRVGRDLGLPVVVNLSLGGHHDPHDGTDSLSGVIDAESGPGRIVVCAAGNEGDEAIHARAAVRAGGQRTISCMSAGPFLLNVWYSGDDELAVAVGGPSGTSTPFQEIKTSGSPTQRYRLSDGMVEISTPGRDPVNGDHPVVVSVSPVPFAEHAERTGQQSAGAGVAPNRTWKLRLRGDKVTNGRVDAWILSGFVLPAAFTGQYVDDAVKVGSPGASTAALTAAAYTTKISWTDAGGAPHSSTLELDDISAFSSEGPRRDDHPKPDAAAAGAMIVSALSQDAAALGDHLVVDKHHVVLAGTSMASPFLAGLVALLLQRDRTLTPDRVRELVRAASAVPGKPAGAFDPKWGHGLVDAAKLA